MRSRESENPNHSAKISPAVESSDDTNRLVYRIQDDSLYILACRGHY